ncbi:MAG: hypothetical protein R3B49_10780 [Phycisphaerales bacterium]
MPVMFHTHNAARTRAWVGRRVLGDGGAAMGYRCARLAGLVLISVAQASAYAQMINFDNSDLSFLWTYGVDLELYTDSLDVTKGPLAQNGVGQVQLLGSGAASSGSPDLLYLAGEWVAYTGTTCQMCDYEVPFSPAGVKALSPGSSIGPGSVFGVGTLTANTGYYGVCVPACTTWDFVQPLDYAGFRFIIGNETHYGWVRLDRVGGFWQPVAWGYQATPGAVAVVPPPPPTEFTVVMQADSTTVRAGDTVNWTVSVSGPFGADGYVYQYDLSFLAADPSLGVATVFADQLDPALFPTPGVPNGASLTGVSGAQSTILGNIAYGPIVLGTFSVQVLEAGTLSYTIDDGGTQPTELLQVKPGSDFAPSLFNGVPLLECDVVTVDPLPLPQVLTGPQDSSRTRGRSGAINVGGGDRRGDVPVAAQWHSDQ